MLCLKLYCALKVPSRLIRQMLAISLELNSKGLHQSSGKEKKVVVFCSRPRQNVRQFHVVVVQQLAEKCTKKRDAGAKLLFCLSKPIAFLPFSLPSSLSLRKLTKVTSLALSQRFGHPHSHIPSVLGIPRYPPGMPKSLVFWSSPPKKCWISRENRKRFRDGFR